MYTMCILLDVIERYNVSHYDFSVLSMSIMGFQKMGLDFQIFVTLQNP